MTISYKHSLHKMYPIQLTIKPYCRQFIFLELNPTVDSFFSVYLRMCNNNSDTRDSDYGYAQSPGYHRQ